MAIVVTIIIVIIVIVMEILHEKARFQKELDEYSKALLPCIDKYNVSSFDVHVEIKQALNDVWWP